MSAVTSAPLVSVTTDLRRPNQILREWMQSITGEGSEIDVPELIQRAHRRFADDPEFREACFYYAVHDLLPTVARGVFASWRQQTKRDFEAEVDRKAHKFYVSLGEGIYRRLPDATRPHLLFDIDDRERQISGHQRVIGAEREIVGLMQNDEETVLQQLGDETLAEIWRRHFEDDH